MKRIISGLIILGITGCGGEQLGELPACIPGNTLVWEGNAWICADDLEPPDPLPSCSQGQSIAFNGGSWVCHDPDPGSLPVCQAGQSINWDGSAWTCQDPLQLPECTAGQSIGWDGADWTCHNPDPGTLPICQSGQSIGWDGAYWTCRDVYEGPPGTVMAYAGSVAPDGWMICDGSEVGREDFASLYTAIGGAHGSGDGITTFNLPDYRGRFLRGVDDTAGRDPDSATRVAPDLGGNDGNRVGSVQDWATGMPITAFVTEVAGAHTHMSNVRDRGSFSHSCCNWNHFQALDSTTPEPTSSDGDHLHSIAGGGDSETRPSNAYVNWIIKY